MPQFEYRLSLKKKVVTNTVMAKGFREAMRFATYMADQETEHCFRVTLKNIRIPMPFLMCNN